MILEGHPEMCRGDAFELVQECFGAVGPAGALTASRLATMQSPENPRTAPFLIVMPSQWASLFEHDVFPTRLLEGVAHAETGVPTSDDNGIDGMRHVRSSFNSPLDGESVRYQRGLSISGGLNEVWCDHGRFREVPMNCRVDVVDMARASARLLGLTAQPARLH